jgi:hypothetical protein
MLWFLHLSWAAAGTTEGEARVKAMENGSQGPRKCVVNWTETQKPEAVGIYEEF